MGHDRDLQGESPLMSSMPQPPQTPVGTPARLQIAYSFPPQSGNANEHYLALGTAGQRFLRSEIGKLVREWFPIEVRDEWLALQIPALTGGTYPANDALALMGFKVQDPRITRSDLGIDPVTIQIGYNIHDDIQCSSIKVDFVVSPAQSPLVAEFEVQDPALPGGQGTFVARFELELKWEVALAQVVI